MEKTTYDWREWFKKEWNNFRKAASRYSNLKQVRIIPMKGSNEYLKLMEGESNRSTETY